MPKLPHKPENTRENEEDYEIVSFEDFCDKSPSCKTDLLTLNDNINYRLCFESNKVARFENEGETSKEAEELKETSLSGGKKGSGSFAPFGRYNPNAPKGSLFSGVIPKPKADGEAGRELRYQRFSAQVSCYERLVTILERSGSTLFLIMLITALFIGVWWAVCGAVGTGGERHYRKLWERAHQYPALDNSAPTERALPEYHYHDHNNLSTKNKLNATASSRKKDINKKGAYVEPTAVELQAVCSKIEQNMRFDCHPQGGATEDTCLQRGCCWNSTVEAYDKNQFSIGVPYCYFPTGYATLRFANMTETRHGISAYYERLRPTGYPDEFVTVGVEFTYMNNDVLRIRIYDAENKRFQPPYPEIPRTPGCIDNLKYKVVVESTGSGFKVIRQDDDVVMLNTVDIGSLIIADKFLQLSTLLPTDKLYGFGERRGPLRVNMQWQSYTMFNVDAPPRGESTETMTRDFDTSPKDNTNLYGTQPFYLGLEDNGKSHGLLFLNSNAMDVIAQPTPALTYRTIGGVLDFFLIMGPSPSDVISQYTEIVGRPFMPPYWSLGFHLCKYNYGNVNETRRVWSTNREAGIPFDVQWSDLDYMNNSNDFTIDQVNYAGLPQFVQEVHDAGMHYVILIDPGISNAETPGSYPPFDRGVDLNIFIKDFNYEIFVGKVWNKISTVYPDFTHPNSTAWWLEQMSDFHMQLPYDGAWIDMNEPSNFLSGPMKGECQPENLPYMPRTIGVDGLKTKTLCMDARQYAGFHYDWHSLYATTESIATHFAMTEIRGKRPFILSRANFVGIGRYTAHWSGDINSSYDDMRMSIPEILSYSLFGIPMTGADICGFRGDASPDLCKRWMELGAFYPFARNHNSDTSTPQDPVSLGPDVVAASRTALRLRYTLLPYYYTLYWRAHRFGETVARPMLFEFPLDNATYNMDNQFMIGPSVVVAPVLYQGQTQPSPYLPAGEKWQTINEAGTVILRGGSILPLQKPPVSGPVTTQNCRSGPMQLLGLADGAGQASGQLYWDDGDSLNNYEEKKYSHIEFKLNQTTLTSSVNWWGFGAPSVNNVTVLSVEQAVSSVTLTNRYSKQKRCDYEYDPNGHVLTVYNMNLSLDVPFSLSWTFQRDNRVRGLNETNVKR